MKQTVLNVQTNSTNDRHKTESIYPYSWGGGGGGDLFALETCQDYTNF